METKYSPNEDQKEIIDRLSKESGISHEEITQFFIEMGIALLVTVKTPNGEMKAIQLLGVLKDKLAKNESVDKLVQTLYDGWKAGEVKIGKSE